MPAQQTATAAHVGDSLQAMSDPAGGIQHRLSLDRLGTLSLSNGQAGSYISSKPKPVSGSLTLYEKAV